MSDPARRVGKAAPFPTCLANLNYTDKEDKLRRAIHHPGTGYGAMAPQEEFPQTDRTTPITPEGDGPMFVEPQLLAGQLGGDPELKFLRGLCVKDSTGQSVRIQEADQVGDRTDRRGNQNPTPDRSTGA